jgi:hypothetical protein
VDGQNIPCATLKKNGVVGNLCISLADTYSLACLFEPLSLFFIFGFHSLI